jgi:intracellular septation protein A
MGRRTSTSRLRFSEAIWVNFKLLGGMGLMLLFMLGQVVVPRALRRGRREGTKQ